MYYWAPDSLDWECLVLGFSDFVSAFLTNRIGAFYEGLRWSTWRADVRGLSGDSCFTFYPFLWTKEGSVEGSHRATAPIQQAFDMKVEIVRLEHHLSAGPHLALWAVNTPSASPTGYVKLSVNF